MPGKLMIPVVIVILTSIFTFSALIFFLYRELNTVNGVTNITRSVEAHLTSWIGQSAKPVHCSGRMAKTIRDDKIFLSSGYKFEILSNKAPFAPRDGAGAVFHNNMLFLIGGWNPNDNIHFPKTTSNDVWRSPDGGESWQLIKPNTYDSDFIATESDFKGRHTAGYVTNNGFIYIIGGDANQGYHISDIYRSSDGIDWTLVNREPPWAPRALHLTFVFNGWIYVAGGQTMPSFTPNEVVGEQYYRDIWRSKDGEHWEEVKVTTPIWLPRGGYGGSGFLLNGEIFILGGFTYDNHVNNQRDIWTDIWKSKDLSNWEQVVEMAPWAQTNGGLMYHNTAFYDGKLWVIGGAKRGTGNTNDIWFSSDGEHWEVIDCSPIRPTHASAVWSTPQGIIIVTGLDPFGEVWKISKNPGPVS